MHLWTMYSVFALCTGQEFLYAKMDANYANILQEDTQIDLIRTSNLIECARLCKSNFYCISFTYNSKRSTCQRNSGMYNRPARVESDYLGNHYYYISSDFSRRGVRSYLVYHPACGNYTLSQQACKSMNGVLAKVEDEEKEAIVTNVLSNISPTYHVRIQGQKVKGEWKFNDGKEVTYFNWAENQPEGGINQTTLSIQPTNRNRWHDEDTKDSWGFLCDILLQ